MAFFDCGGIRILLSLPETPELHHPSSTVYFKVEDIKAVYGILKDRGVPFDSEPHKIADMPDHELWMAFFRDVDKNVLALMSEIPKN